MQPAAEQHLLLVAAREARDGRLERRRADPQPAQHAPRVVARRARVHDAEPVRISRQVRQDRRSRRPSASGTTPVSRRSSVRSAMPRRLASMGERMTTSRPLTRIVPEAIARRPKMASTSSVRCAPTRPPMPRTSPRCSRNEMSRNEPGRGEVSASTSSSTSPGRHVATRVAVGQVAPDHARDDLVDRQRRRSATSRPCVRRA